VVFDNDAPAFDLLLEAIAHDVAKAEICFHRHNKIRALEVIGYVIALIGTEIIDDFLHGPRLQD
jgi:hypothetical protein